MTPQLCHLPRSWLQHKTPYSHLNSVSSAETHGPQNARTKLDSPSSPVGATLKWISAARNIPAASLCPIWGRRRMQRHTARNPAKRPGSAPTTPWINGLSHSFLGKPLPIIRLKYVEGRSAAIYGKSWPFQEKPQPLTRTQSYGDPASLCRKA